ncbi:site-specific integrase [Anabaena sp. FACHB-1237]|uniref:site-specific integrase n=1 Tax=Anabaena sp. FACHB-1237 TaxID=2692769 RepID=UPI0016803081|nr:site-specific integrase [Anabaena sp. FACHB-1237]MBD2138707.1 site-specific integrase [Anabaena sp. FACHB-1237]
MNFPDQDIFDGYEPPASTDGSYRGNIKQMQATQTHLQNKFNQELDKVKGRLKAGKVKVGLVVSKNTIQLQASLPIRPGDADRLGTGYRQYKISLNIPANLDGLKTAEEEAQELGKLIARKTFEWNDKYLGKGRISESIRTIGDVLETFENEYFKTHKLTEKSKHTFSYYLDYLKRYVGCETLLTQESIELAIEKLDNQHAKQSAVKTLKVLRNTLKLTTFNLDNIKIKKPQPQIRDIPSDEDVVTFFQNFSNYAQTRKGTIKKDLINTWKLWQWVYGMLATYGLRPRELFVNPDINWWLSADNTDNTWKVDKDTKTGYREALPLYPDWVELFDLKNAEYLELLKNQTDGRNNFTDINTIRVNCSSWFRRVNIPFTPYDLRHAWAIRAHIMGIPIKAAADNLGHSVEIHTEIYQKWFSLDNRKKVIKMAIDRQEDIEFLKEENLRLKAEIELLKSQLIRYQLEHLTN